MEMLFDCGHDPVQMSLGSGGYDLNDHSRSESVDHKTRQTIGFAMDYPIGIRIRVTTFPKLKSGADAVSIKRSLRNDAFIGKNAAGDQGVRMVVGITKVMPVGASHLNNLADFRCTFDFSDFVAENPFMSGGQTAVAFRVELDKIHSATRYL